jgi:DNA-binding XRE family transcriptional regulator
MNASQFKQLRKKMEMSQVELAQHLGVSRVAVYYWEHGKRGIDKVLELAMSYLAEHTVTATTKRRSQR